MADGTDSKPKAGLKYVDLPTEIQTRIISHAVATGDAREDLKTIARLGGTNGKTRDILGTAAFATYISTLMQGREVSNRVMSYRIDSPGLDLSRALEDMANVLEHQPREIRSWLFNEINGSEGVRKLAGFGAIAGQNHLFLEDERRSMFSQAKTAFETGEQPEAHYAARVLAAGFDGMDKSFQKDVKNIALAMGHRGASLAQAIVAYNPSLLENDELRFIVRWNTHSLIENGSAPSALLALQPHLHKNYTRGDSDFVIESAIRSIREAASHNHEPFGPDLSQEIMDDAALAIFRARRSITPEQQQQIGMLRITNSDVDNAFRNALETEEKVLRAMELQASKPASTENAGKALQDLANEMNSISSTLDEDKVSTKVAQVAKSANTETNRARSALIERTREGNVR